MDAVMSWCFWLSFVALLATKVADVVSTWRHVGVRGETNPLAAALFRRFGLAWGIVIVSAVYVGIALGQYLCVWSIGWVPLLWANTLLGFAIAWVQWDVARLRDRLGAVGRGAVQLDGATLVDDAHRDARELGPRALARSLACQVIAAQ